MNFKYPHSDHPPKPPAIKKKKPTVCFKSHFNFFNSFSHLLSLPVSQTSTLRKITGNLYNRCSFPGELFSQTLKELQEEGCLPWFQHIIAGWQVKIAMMMGRMTPQLLVNEWLSFQVPFEASLCFFPFLSSLFHLPKDMLNEVRSDTSDNFSIHTKIKAPVTFEWHGSFMDPFLPCFIPLAEWLRAAVHWRAF